MSNIFAPITLIGGGICVIRISGERALNCLEYFGIRKNLEPNKIKFITLNYNEKFLDECLICYFKSPNSFTGEDVLEFHLHASHFIVQEFLDILAKIPGFRFAKNGEFTKRALLNGKIDLIKSEGINNLIKSESREQHKLASQMMTGNISEKYRQIREKIIDIIAKMESLIDFPEEDIPENIFDDARNELEILEIDIQNSINDNKKNERILQGLSFAIIGEPNVGKSSLINALSQREIAIVSDIAGTTRDVLSTSIDVNGYKVTFFDTAGIHENPSNIIEEEGIRRAKEILKNADFTIIMLDINKDLNFNQIKEFSNTTSIKRIFVYNKIDKLENFEYEIKKKKNELWNYLIENEIDQRPIIVEISLIKKDFQSLIEEVSNIIKKELSGTESIIFNERHRGILIAIFENLKKMDFQKPIEISLEDLRCIASLIGQITGEIYTNDILDVIFSKFCIGK